MIDLTDSVYSMIVLTYATLAATAYLFKTTEDRANLSLEHINALKSGPCKFIWENQKKAFDEQRLGAPRSPLIRVIDEYDTISSGTNSKVERWVWLQYLLFISVAIAAILFLPVLLLKMDVVPDGIWNIILADATKLLLVLEQMLASISVPMVGFNLRKMRGKLTRIEKFEQTLVTWETAFKSAGHENSSRPSRRSRSGPSV